MAKEKEEKNGKKEISDKKKRPFFMRLSLCIMKSILKIIIGVIIMMLVGFILAAIGAVLLYNFFPIKTVNLCVGNEFESLNVPCQSADDCTKNILEMAKSGEATGDSSEKISQGLDLINGFLNTVLKDAVSCNNKICEIKKVRGIQEAFEQGGTIQCIADEKVLNVKITPKMIFPPSTIKNIAQEFIKTRKIEMPSI